MNSKDLDLLERWLEDQSFINWANNDNARDIKHWNDHFKTHPQFLELGEMGRQMVKGLPFVPNPIEDQQVEASLNSFERKLKENMSDAHSIDFKSYFKYAVAVCVVLAVVSTLFFRSSFYNTVLLKSGNGQLSSHVLPDSTTVVLNANSSLTYDRRNPRLVTVEGELFFKVRKQEGHHFQVVTADARITVLGTEFNVNTRNENTRVYLQEGKVSLQLNGFPEPIDMLPGEEISYLTSKRSFVRTKHEPMTKKPISWLEGSVSFINKPIAEVIEEIEEIYGVKFTFRSDEFRTEKITMGIPVNDLEVVNEVLETVLGATVTQTGDDKYVIK